MLQVCNTDNPDDMAPFKYQEGMNVVSGKTSLGLKLNCEGV